MAGIKETKEVLDAGAELTAFIVGRLADGGVDFSDGTALVAKVTGDAEFQAKLIAAGKGISKVPDELKDIDLSEAKELSNCGFNFAEKVIAAVNEAKKKNEGSSE